MFEKDQSAQEFDKDQTAQEFEMDQTVQDIDKAISVGCGHAGACQHALGYHDQAVHDYEKAFSIDSGNKEKVPDEARSQQFLAFYQKELALYIRKHLDDPVLSFCLDKELHPIFKVWEACQAAHLKQQPLNPESAALLGYDADWCLMFCIRAANSQLVLNA